MKNKGEELSIGQTRVKAYSKGFKEGWDKGENLKNGKMPEIKQQEDCCVVCLKPLPNGSIGHNFPDTLGIKETLPFCSFECSEVVENKIKAKRRNVYVDWLEQKLKALEDEK